MAKKKQWDDLDAKQKKGLKIGGIVQIALLAAALYDLRRRPEEQIRGSKKMWSAFVFVNFIGPVSYFVAGRKR